MEIYSICYEIVCFLDRRVVDGLRSERFDAHDLVPEDIARGDLPQLVRIERVRAPHQALARRAALVERGAAVVRADGGLKLPLGEPGADPFPLDELPHANR